MRCHEILNRSLVETAGSDILANPAFRAWFRNSKVVDAAGNPLVVFHGSNAHAYVAGRIESFQTSPSSGRGAAFFTSSGVLAKEYGERVYGVYLRIENPLVVFGDGKHWQSLDRTVRVSGGVPDALRKHHRDAARELDDIFAELAELDGEDHPGSAPSRSRIPDDKTTIDDLGLGIIMGDDSHNSTDDIVKKAKRFGYDGVIFRDINDSPTADRYLYKNTASDVYAVFSSYQVKSTENNGEFSLDDSNIYE